MTKEKPTLSRRIGLPRMVLATSRAEAHVYQHGAQVTHYQPRGDRPVLFLSRHSAFAAGQPIRGGVPICFPWFGRKPDDPRAPAHGFARRREWTVESSHATDAAAEIWLRLAAEEPVCLVRYQVR